MTPSRLITGALVALIVCVVAAAPAKVASAGVATDAKVTVGTPTGNTPQNVQSETAIAADPVAPDILVAGANEWGDMAPCPQSSTLIGDCARSNPSVFNSTGLSGVYFSFDRGHHWTQPTYTGLTGFDCAAGDSCGAHYGPIHTLPWYSENGLAGDGDPAVAFGPVPVDGRFSWANGSRLYYGNLVANLNPVYPNSKQASKGLFATAVSRLDNPTPGRVAQKSSWMTPVIASIRNSAVGIPDKDQIWADDAASSPLFGNVYLCWADYNGQVSGKPRALSGPIDVASSSDGGDSWSVKQVSAAFNNNGAGALHSDCTLRTDSHGVVYLFYAQFELGLPGLGSLVLQTSADGGKSWTRPHPILAMNDMCFQGDVLSGDCVADGQAGARTSFSAGPSVDIANGAPTGADATDEIAIAWSDGRFGFGSESTLVSWSTDRGASWHDPAVASEPGDRSIYSAPAISPDGRTMYVVYEALGAPWLGADMFTPRPYRGVFRESAVGADGAPTSWSTVYAGPWGDLRGTYPGHLLDRERVGDYVYATATRSYGAGVWSDARNAPVCDAIQQFRANSVAAGALALPAPWPLAACPADWGNVDVWSATTG